MLSDVALIIIICTVLCICLHFTIFGVTAWALIRQGRKYSKSAGDMLCMIFILLIPIFGDFIGVSILAEIIAHNTEDI